MTGDLCDTKLLRSALVAVAILFAAPVVHAQDTEPADAGQEAPAESGEAAAAPADAGQAGNADAGQPAADTSAASDANDEQGGFTFGDDSSWEDADSFFDEEGESAIDALLEEPEWNGMRFGLGGYYRLNYMVLGNPDVQGSQDEDGPKQVNLFQHRLRLLPGIGLNDKTVVKMDISVGQGLKPCDPDTLGNYYISPCEGILGANGITVLDSQLSDAFANVTFNRFWGEVTTPVGLLRVGRQPSNWGLGIFSNDGLHESEFGIAEFGDTYDRIAFATKPMGADSDLITALVYDIISEGTPELGVAGAPEVTKNSKDIHEGIIVLLYTTAPLDVGVYQVIRANRSDRHRIYATDIYGRLDIGLLYGAIESVWVYGTSEGLPFLDQSDLSFHLGDEVKIAQWGWAGEIGLRFDWYDFKVKYGNAQGDQNLTNDRPKPKITGITFRPDYNVGLIMFDYAYANLVERRIDANFDRLNVLVDDGVLTPGQVEDLEIAADLARTRGGVSNAFFINPIAVLQPTPEIRTKLGMLWAQSNSGIAVLGDGSHAVYKHDLGWEFDAGVDYTYRDKFVFGIEGGVLLPGSVFDEPRTELDEVSGLDVPVYDDLRDSDPVYLGRVKFQFNIY